MDVQEVYRWSAEVLGQLRDAKRGAETVRKSSLGLPSAVTMSACETVEAGCEALISALWTLRYQLASPPCREGLIMEAAAERALKRAMPVMLEQVAQLAEGILFLRKFDEGYDSDVSRLLTDFQRQVNETARAAIALSSSINY